MEDSNLLVTQLEVKRAGEIWTASTVFAGDRFLPRRLLARPSHCQSLERIARSRCDTSCSVRL